MGSSKVFALLALSTFLIINPLNAEQSAQPLARTDGENLAAAIGHYARSRSLLIEAVREFDRATRLADPNALLDTKRWRASLVDRTQELDRILDPQPRVTKGGIKYKADKRLLNEAKD